DVADGVPSVAAPAVDPSDVEFEPGSEVGAVPVVPLGCDVSPSEPLAPSKSRLVPSHAIEPQHIASTKLCRPIARVISIISNGMPVTFPTGLHDIAFRFPTTSPPAFSPLIVLWRPHQCHKVPSCS